MICILLISKMQFHIFFSIVPTSPSGNYIEAGSDCRSLASVKSTTPVKMEWLTKTFSLDRKNELSTYQTSSGMQTEDSVSPPTCKTGAFCASYHLQRNKVSTQEPALQQPGKWGSQMDWVLRWKGIDSVPYDQIPPSLPLLLIVIYSWACYLLWEFYIRTFFFLFYNESLS